MHFLPRPGGSSEDDGVLVTIVFDGPKEQVRLLHLDLELVLMLLSTVTFSCMADGGVLMIITIVIDHRANLFWSQS